MNQVAVSFQHSAFSQTFLHNLQPARSTAAGLFSFWLTADS
jgi:hypothetical protein